MNDPSPDQALIEQIQEQQSWAFEALYERYATHIRRHLCHMVSDEPVAEDLLQETFLRVWTHAWQWNLVSTGR